MSAIQFQPMGVAYVNGNNEQQSRRILYVDPSLSSHRGHHSNVCASTVKAMRGAGQDVRVVISRQAEDYLEGERDLRFDVYQHMHLNPKTPGDQRALKSAAAKFCSEIIPALIEHKPHVVYAHSVGAVACEGIMQAISTLYSADSPPLFLVELPFPSEPKPGYYYGEQLADMFSRLKRHQPLLLKTIVPLTVNADTSRLLAAAVGYPIETLPSPYSITQRRATVSLDPNRPIRIGSVGHQVETKGFFLLPEIFKAVADVGRSVQFVVQVQDESDPCTLARLRDAQAQGIEIELIEQDLDRIGYESLMRSLDIVLLPYDPQRYVSAISGVCYEALAQGSVVVAPLKTTVGSLMTQFQPNSPLFEQWTSDSIAASLRQAICNFDLLISEAELGVDKYLAENGPSVYANAVIANAPDQTMLSPIGRRPWLATAMWSTRSAIVPYSHLWRKAS